MGARAPVGMGRLGFCRASAWYAILGMGLLGLCPPLGPVGMGLLGVGHSALPSVTASRAEPYAQGVGTSARSQRKVQA